MSALQNDPRGDGTHRPRPNDHLVEPFFGGLGVERDPADGSGEGFAEVDDVDLAPSRSGWFQRLLRTLTRG